jgi:hypothetical protein
MNPALTSVAGGRNAAKCELGYPDEQDEARMQIAAVLIALLCALVEFILYSFRVGFLEKYVFLHHLERRNCFTGLVWMPKLH